jgi:hypothetical protein
MMCFETVHTQPGMKREEQTVYVADLSYPGAQAKPGTRTGPACARSGYEMSGYGGRGGKEGRRHGALGLVVDRRRGGVGGEASKGREAKARPFFWIGRAQEEEQRQRGSERDSHQRLG